MAGVSSHGYIPFSEVAREYTHPNPDGRPLDKFGRPVLYSQSAGPFRRKDRLASETLIRAGESLDLFFPKREP